MFIALIAAAAVTAPAPAPIDPDSWFGPNSYPMEAQKKGIEGSVKYDVSVDRKGEPKSCRIVASSGSSILDRATCKTVLSKAHFTPAIGPDGKAVAGHFSNKAIWHTADKSAALYRAVIIDFSADPLHPVCTIQSAGNELAGPTCTQLEDEASTGGLPQKLKKLVYLLSMTPDGDVPYRGEPDWGHRVTFLATDQYTSKGSFPIACISVAAEGATLGRDGCDGFPGAHTLTDAEKQKATRTRVELTIFSVPRESPPGMSDTTAAVGASGAAASANPLLLAEKGELQCYRPDVQKKTCQAIAFYRRTGPGTYDNTALFPVGADATLETHGPVVIKGRAVCGFVRGQDAIAGTLRVGGKVLDPEKAKPILERVAQVMAPMADKEICTTYEPAGADFMAKISIGGSRRPDQDEAVKWITPADGYTVTP
jgi:TonB family protein